MKIKRIVLAIGSLFAIAPVICAQTASNYVAQGRAYLAATNPIAANLSFSNALALTPSDPTANALYAGTRLLVLPYQAAGSNFLDRLGVTNSGRSIYHWTAGLPVDSSGVPLAPVGVNADEFTSILRTNVLAQISAAESNLAGITDTNFTIDLTSEETTTVAVTIDYGDIQLLRAMLDTAECFIYETYTWNLNVQLTAVRAFYTNDNFSMGDLLANYPGLLDYDTTNDLANAENAFTNAVGRYMIASDLIRNRPMGEVRLFNFADYEAAKEMNFRKTLADLENSLNGAVPLSINPRYTVFLAPQFSGSNPVRSFLPQFHGGGFVLGTLPDPTFAGLYTGLSDAQVEGFFARYFSPIPLLLSSPTGLDSGLGFVIRGLRGRGYVIQVSSNLTTWTDDTPFVALGDAYNFNDSAAGLFPHRFYRVVDRTASMPAPPNDDFAHRIELGGWGVVTTGYNVNATVENNEPGDGEFATVWWSWTAPSSGTVIVGTAGSTFYPYAEIYTGSSLANLSFVSYGNQPFTVVGGTTYQIQVGTFGSTGGIEIAISSPPALTLSSPPGDIVSLSPTNILIQASATDPYGTITNVQIYANGTYLTNTTNTSISFNWTNVGPGVYYVDVQAADNFGITSDSFFQVTVRPPNDDFANRIPITGDPATVTGSNEGASSEPGEPNHNGDAGGVSVWWTWTSPSNGSVTMTASLVSEYGYPFEPILAVYTGTVLSDLTSVASAQGDGIMSPAQLSFNAMAGVSYQIAVDEVNGNEGQITLSLQAGSPPTIVITSPSDGATVEAPVNLPISAVAADPAGVITQVAFYDYEFYPPVLRGVATNVPYEIVWSNVPVGDYTLEAVAIDSRGFTAYANTVGVNVTPPPPLEVATLALPSATNGVDYDFQLIAEFGRAPYSWSLLSGVLPPGLTLANNGIIYGIPTTLGTADFTVRVTDSAGTYATQPLAVSVVLAFATLHSFQVFTNGEIFPYGVSAPNGLVQGDDGTFYGTTTGGGTNGGAGTVFKVTTNGLIVSLYSFADEYSTVGPNGLVEGKDGYLYGTTYSGGSYGDGTVFKISTNGSLTTLHSFTDSDGRLPYGTLVQGADGQLYGTTYYGGTNGGAGTVFKISTNGAMLSLYSFAGLSDGGYPSAGLALGSDGNFYGTTSDLGFDGPIGSGNIFKITANGALTVLYSFNSGFGSVGLSQLTQGTDGYLYGTTSYSAAGYGSVFKISTNGVLTSLHTFSGSSDGSFPSALVQGSDGNFYGTTLSGGATTSDGTVFQITSGGAFSELYSFSGVSDGAYPSGLATGQDGYLYGLTGGDFPYGSLIGTFFKISTNGTLVTLSPFEGVNDGAQPKALTLGSDANFYGTTYYGKYYPFYGGGFYGFGTVFRMGTNGEVTNLYSFTGTNDGANPNGLQEYSDGYFYGTTSGGGTSGAGAVFKISTNGALTTFYSFSGINDGASPLGNLAVGNDGYFYGITQYGSYSSGSGYEGYGTAFKIGTNGELSTLHFFSDAGDGAYPLDGIVQGTDGYFYGTTSGSGANASHGTVFKITLGGVFTPLYSFSGTSDGSRPLAALIQGGDGYFYGTTSSGGASGAGTVFKISTNGILETLYSFLGGEDGGAPNGRLVQGSDGYFYSTTSAGSGGVFRISAIGVLTALYSFTGGSDGSTPNATLVQGSGGNFYGTTERGGEGGSGTVFSLHLPPSVSFTATPSSGVAPITVSFTSTSVDSDANSIVAWDWSFGDGSSSPARSPSHTYTTAGNFTPTLIATNNLGGTVIGLGPGAITVTANLGLVVNGGFETGDFTGWNLSGPDTNDIVVDDGSITGISPHSGDYLAELGPVGSLSYLSQAIPTTPGADYSLSLWLDSPDGETPNEFLVAWNGIELFDKSDIPAIGWTNLQFTVSATGNSAVLEFGARNDNSYFGLDDVSVILK